MCISNLNCYMFVCISNLNCYVLLSISKLNCYVFLEQTLPFVIWVASSYLSARSLSLARGVSHLSSCFISLYAIFFIFSVISVLSFANLHINNVTCKLFCCFLTTNPNSCFAVICILFPLFLMSFCVSSSFSVFLFSVFCALLSPFSFLLRSLLHSLSLLSIFF